MAIKTFRGQYGFLSNMYDCKVRINGLEFGSSEGAFQAFKSEDRSIQNKFCTLTGIEAKKKGKAVKKRKDWDDVKLGVMYRVLQAKFTQNPELADKLLDTGDEYLAECNWWRDDYWGIWNKTGKGENMLGKLLMVVRAEIRDGDIKVNRGL